MKALWQTRLRQHAQAQFKYLRLVFNDHFVLVLIIGLGALLYGYAQLVAGLTRTWWLPLIVAAVLTVLAAFGRLATIVEKADATFLLPQTEAFSKYLFKARRYSLMLPSVVLVLATLASVPMLQVLQLDVIAAIPLGVALLAFKDCDLWLQLLANYQSRPHWLRRGYLFVVIFVALSLGLFVHPALSLVVALACNLGLRWRLSDWLQASELDWLVLSASEARRMGQLYRFYNLFTDVPGLQGTVRRRKYLDGIARLVRKTPQYTWAWLLVRSFLRRTEFFGLYLRLVVVGAVVVALASQWWLAAALAALFVYLIGFQLLPMYQVHDDIVFAYLYPLPATQKPAAFKALVARLLVLAAVVMSLAALALGHWLAALGALLAGVAMAIAVAGWYLPLRLQKTARQAVR